MILELKITKKRIFLKGGLLEQPRSEKWNKQMYIFEKGGSFGAVQVEKVKSLGAAQAEKWGAGGFTAAHTRTALIWEYPPPIPEYPHRGCWSPNKKIRASS